MRLFNSGSQVKTIRMSDSITWVGDTHRQGVSQPEMAPNVAVTRKYANMNFPNKLEMLL